MRNLLAVLLLVASCGFVFAQKALTNEDIIKMVKSGLPEDVILQAIEVQPSNFDISAQALIELKQQGVSNGILNKILDVAAARRFAASPQKTVSIIQAIAAGSPADRPSFPVAFAGEQVSFDGPEGAPQSEGKIYVGYGLLRFERIDGGRTEITLVNPKSRTGYIVGPGDDVQVVHNFAGVVGYVGEAGLSKYFLPVDPAEPCRDYKGLIACRAITQEYVNSRQTMKWEFTHALGGETWNSYEWIDPKLRVAVRRQYKDHVTELRNIQEGPQPTSLFEVPATLLK
jgi:hypothetical protein